MDEEQKPSSEFKLGADIGTPPEMQIVMAACTMAVFNQIVQTSSAFGPAYVQANVAATIAVRVVAGLLGFYAPAQYDEVNIDNFVKLLRSELETSRKRELAEGPAATPTSSAVN